MRVFIGGLATETNTFAPFPTGLSGFQEYGLQRNSSIISDTPLSGPLKVFRERAEADRHDVIETIGGFAQPAGRTVKAVYEQLRDNILDDLRVAGKVDIVLLLLHGAMVAQDYDDCEGDIIAHVRELAPEAVIGIELDPHCHLTETMIERADLIILAKEYPHIDFNDRAHELYDLCRRTALGDITPVAALVDTKMIGFYPTFDPPMLDIVTDLKAAEKRPAILSASIAHGFPWGDVADVGTRVLVYADRDAAVAAEVGQEFVMRLYEARHALTTNYPAVAESLDRAQGLNGHVVLGDFSDNPGGGAPGDSTFLLRAMLERRITDAVIGTFWDPMVAHVCADAGVGAVIDIRLGGKSGATSGDPIDLTVEVKGIVENHSATALGGRQPMGLSVWLHANGIDIAVCSIRTQTFAPDAFTGLGIDLTDKPLVVVKSSNHYQAGFRGGCDHLWHVTSPGTLDLDFAAMPYTRRDGDYYPRVDDPWAKSGIPEPRIFHRNARAFLGW